MIRQLRAFAQDTRAAVAFEAVIITPILAWCFVGSFIFFDAFRTYTTSVKATFSIADVLSRDTDWIYDSDIEGLGAVFQHMIRNGAGSSMRVSEVFFDGTSLSVVHSVPTNGETRLRDTDIPSIQDQIPIMAPNESVIVVETFVPYSPYFDIGLGDLEFTNFTVTRPRFAGQLRWAAGNEPGCTSCNAGDAGETGDPVGDDLFEAT